MSNFHVPLMIIPYQIFLASNLKIKLISSEKILAVEVDSIYSLPKWSDITFEPLIHHRKVIQNNFTILNLGKQNLEVTHLTTTNLKLVVVVQFFRWKNPYKTPEFSQDKN